MDVIGILQLMIQTGSLLITLLQFVLALVLAMKRK
ncbi:putative holin-like toxin [Alicyclobacillus vulcanalis]|uniref:Uncharacterized protein n=1 Tax=Alicyclobacillus vulcanalis TaxID=252246 RepID=A0A1N7PJ50_9BACL|nr:putative holin-like toxin [Alicyclobacillus vulcanalis]SIT10655.1 hypothetical protein SAMN05421799_1147 [Alicyclobacillus vulcanalis]